MIRELLLVLSVLFYPGKAEVCLATTFAQPGDKWLGGDSPVLRRKILPTDNGVAHREFPLGGWVAIYNIRTGKSTEARVIDRGPFGRVDGKGRWYNGVSLYRHAIRNGKPIPRDGWRGCLDMTPRVARSVGSNGMDPVLVRALPPRKKRKHATPSRVRRGSPHR